MSHSKNVGGGLSACLYMDWTKIGRTFKLLLTSFSSAKLSSPLLQFPHNLYKSAHLILATVHYDLTPTSMHCPSKLAIWMSLDRHSVLHLLYSFKLFLSFSTCLDCDLQWNGYLFMLFPHFSTMIRVINTVMHNEWYRM